MAYDIGPVIGIEGEKEFKNAISNINKEMSLLGSEMKKVTAQFSDNANSMSALTSKNKVLTSQVEEQRNKVNTLQDALKKAKQEYGENSDQVRNWQKQLNNAEADLAKLENQVTQNEKAIKEYGQAQTKAALNSEEFSKAQDKLKTMVKAVAVVVAAAGAAVLAFAKNGLELASDLAEVQNVVDVTFGDGAKIIDQWAKDAAEAYGLSILSAKQYTGTMGAMLKSMQLSDDVALDMSTSLVGLAGDMASFYNLDHETAFEKIRSGISGETEPLKQLGINMSVTNLEAYALSQGITEAYSSMTEAEKVTLRYNYLMQVTADAQGDFARTSDGFANQQRILKLEIQNLSASLGEKLLPIINEMMPKIIDFVKNIDLTPITNALDWILENIDKIAAGAAALGAAMITWNVVATVQAVVKAIKGWQLATEGMTVAQKLLNLAMAANPIGIIITAVAALVAAIVVLWNTNEDFRKKVVKIWNSIKDFFIELGAKIKEIFNAIWTWIKDNVIQPMIDRVEAIKASWQSFKDKIFEVWTAVANWISDKWNWLKNNVFTPIKNVIDDVKEKFQEFRTKAEEVFEAVRAWIEDKIGKAIEKITNFINKIKSAIDWLKELGEQAEESSTLRGTGIYTASTSGSGYTGATYAEGTDYVPYTGYALLHKGEAVLTAEENAARGSGAPTGRTVIINLNTKTASKSEIDYIIRQANIQFGMA